MSTVVIGWRAALLVQALVIGWYLIDSVIFGNQMIGQSGDWSLYLAGSLALALPAFGAVTLLFLLWRPSWVQSFQQLLGRATATVFISGLAFLIIFFSHFSRGQLATALAMVSGWFALASLTRLGEDSL